MMHFGHIGRLIKRRSACHLISWCLGNLVIFPKLEHKSYWAVKQLNADYYKAGKERQTYLNLLDEFRNEAFENSAIYKERHKTYHDKMIDKREFFPGDLVATDQCTSKTLPRKAQVKVVRSFQSQDGDEEWSFGARS